MRKCPGCQAELGADFSNRFCSNCGYPVNETTEEQKKFVGRLKVMRITLEEEWKKINRVRIFLFIIAGLTLLVGVFTGLASNNSEGVVALTVLNIVLAIIYLTLGLLVKRYPLPVCVIGLVLFVSIHLLNAFADPKTIIQGILLKIFVVSSFIYGILAARKVKYLAADLSQYSGIKLS